MAYADGEAAILTRIRAHANYDSGNTSRSDWKILDSGKSSFYAVVKPSMEPAPLEYITPIVYVVHWVTTIEVWQKYTDETITQNNLYGHVNEIMAQVQAQKTLGRSSYGVQQAEIVAINAPQTAWTKDGVPAYLVQEITVRWHEQNDVTHV
jgi:hypothetical protein